MLTGGGHNVCNIHTIEMIVEGLCLGLLPVSSCMCVLSGERMVDVGGTVCACGGTHVKNTADIQGVTVTKIKKVRDIRSTTYT